MNPRLTELFITFLKLGITAFGGPAMVFYIRKITVDKKKWLDSNTFQEGVALAQAIPGATAMQVAAFVGIKTRGIVGGVISFTAFALPAFLLMLSLSYIYSRTSEVPLVLSIFSGLQVIVISIVLLAAWSFTKPIIRYLREVLIASLAFALFLLKVNPFYIIILCFLFSQLVFKDSSFEPHRTVKKAKFSGIFIIFLILSIILLNLYFLDNTLFNLAVTMVKIDLFAFGGAYASVPLMFHEFVERLGWLDQKTLLDGIALGQITPGPIVITSTFVGFLTKGISGAVVSTIYTFSPSLLLIALSTQFSEKISSSSFFVRAKRGLLASFSGLLLFVTVKFALSVDWNLSKVLIFIFSFLGLLRGISVPLIVLIGVLFSALFNQVL